MNYNQREGMTDAVALHLARLRADGSFDLMVAAILLEPERAGNLIVALHALLDGQLKAMADVLGVPNLLDQFYQAIINTGA